MPFTTAKFHKILLSGFRGVALTNCFSRIFHFGQISKFKQGVTPRKFQEILLSGFRGIALTRKTRLTDWLTGQNTIPSATRCHNTDLFKLNYL